MTFHIGQKVTLIKNSKKWMSIGGPVPIDVPRLGQILVIKDMDVWAGRQYLEFPEWPNAMWDAHYFRPVVETDISIFTAMLAPKRVTEAA